MTATFVHATAHPATDKLATDKPEAFALRNEVEPPRAGAWLLKPIEWLSAALLVVIVSLLLAGVISRYVFSAPLVWVD
jgi:hypothetical protein